MCEVKILLCKKCLEQKGKAVFPVFNHNDYSDSLSYSSCEHTVHEEVETDVFFRIPLEVQWNTNYGKEPPTYHNI